MIFNERIKLLRREHRLTQAQVARAGGMVVRAYQRLENEEARTHYTSLLKLADYFQVSVDWLMGRTDDRELHQL